MNKPSKNIFFLAGLFLLPLVSTLFFFHVRSYYLAEKERLKKEICDAFDEAIKKDVSIRKGMLTEGFHFGSTPSMNKDSVAIIIPGREMRLVEKNRREKTDEQFLAVIQSVLHRENPMKAAMLDSVFRLELQRRNIELPTGIIVVDNEKSIVSSNIQDISYFSPVLEESLSLGLENEISVRAFVSLSSWFVLGRMPDYYWYITGGWLLLVTGLGIFIPYHHKKTKKEVSENIARQLIGFSNEETGRIVREQENKKKPANDRMLTSNNGHIELTEYLSFDTSHKRLVYRGAVVDMAPQAAKTLQAFVEAPGHFLSTEAISRKVWNREEVTHDTIRRCISRLNKELETAPGLKVVSMQGRGYQLFISREVMACNV